MIEELMSTYGNRLVIAVLGVGLGLLCLVAVLWIMRGRNGPSPFIKGGKNRQPRLQVLDAAAVDTRRRLVLVRRDNVEHLVMIGGPTDIVIESGIGQHAASLQAINAHDMTQERPAPIAPPPTRPQLVENDTAKAVLAAPVAASVLAAQPAAAVAEPVEEPPQPQQAQAPEPRDPTPVAAPPVAPQPDQPQPVSVTHAETAPPIRMEPEAPAIAVDTDLESAAMVLDAARERVIAPQPPKHDTFPASEPVAARLPERIEPGELPQTRNGNSAASDFERILEEEMARNLAEHHNQPPPIPAGSTRREPVPPPISGADAEPSIQKEIARIFGEMSVTRDDR